MGRTLIVPLFPLPGTVLFPGIVVPFYVFEPRYRAMLAEALDGPGLIGVPLVVPGFEGPAEGSPPFAPVFGIGSVENYVTHSDGTSHILVRGRWTARLLAELPPAPSEVLAGTAFRRARAEIVEELPARSGDGRAVRALLRAVAEEFERLAPLPDEVRAVLDKLVAGDDGDPAPVLHLLCTVAVQHPLLRQELLEVPDLRTRAQRLQAMVRTEGRHPSDDPRGQSRKDIL